MRGIQASTKEQAHAATMWRLECQRLEEQLQDAQRERDELQERFLSLHTEHMRLLRRVVLGMKA